jgi:hypothetical protein
MLQNNDIKPGTNFEQPTAFSLRENDAIEEESWAIEIKRLSQTKSS